MKIAIISNNLKIGGKEKQISLLLNQLEKSNLDYCLILRQNIINYSIKSGKVILLSNESFLYNLKELNSFLTQYKPDIVHSWEGYVSFLAALACFGRKYSFVDGSIRFARYFHWYKLIRIKTFIVSLMADKVVANSKAGLVSFNLKYNSKYRVIRNGIDLENFAKVQHFKSERYSKYFVIGMVANFTPAKDYHTLIKVITRLLDEKNKVKCIAVGDGSFKENSERMIQDKYRNSFIFTGLQNEPLKWVREFNVGVLLSNKGHSEGMSNSIMEYMALRKPVIATRTGGNPELVSDGESGFLIDFEDGITLYEKIKLLIKNPEISEAMGEKGYEIIKRNNSKEIYFDKWLELYNELV